MEHTHYAGPQPTQYGLTTSTTPNAFDSYSDFARYLSGRKCATCNVGFVENNKDVNALFHSWLQGKVINSQVKCRKCSKATCLACLGKSASTEIDVNGIKVSWCCSRGRLFMVWIMLCGFDQKYCDAKQRDARTTASGRTNKDKGVGYDMGNNRDMDFGNMFGRGTSFARGISQAPDAGRAKAQDAEKKKDEFYKLLFSFLAVLCPTPDRNKTNITRFDVEPPKAVVSMLLNSKILDKAAELLRNDSLDDATKRKDLYTAFFAFLRNVGVHEVSKQEVMFNDRVILPDNVNLLTLSFQGRPHNAVSEKASPLADNLRNLNIQSHIMMRGAQKARNEFQDQQGYDLLVLCREISDLSVYLGIKSEERSVATDHGIVEVADDKIWPTFYYTREAQRATQSPKGRMRRLITELTTLKTGLSKGIYVKHALSRLDVMKIVIVGPEGTPYENGLFEFDLWCPAEFPYVPPKVWFKGTEGGLSFNPNLHPDGKVCLSLLGTFVGEPWRPAGSTILQVLISIQAMIFCDDPMSNVPYSDERVGVSQNSGYNKNIRGLTAKHGILNWAQDPPSLWKDVANLEFKKNGDRILQTVERWARESQSEGFRDPRPPVALGGMFGDFASTIVLVDIAGLLPDLQAALRKYGATYIPQRIAPLSSQQTPSRRGPEFGSRGFPHGQGNRFDGPGDTSRHGVSGLRFGRGF